MSRYQEEHVAELQWLEDGVKVLAGYSFLYTKVIVLGLFQLYRQRRS